MVALSPEEELFRSLLMWAVHYEFQLHTQDREYPNQVRRLREKLAAHLPVCTEAQLEAYLPRRPQSPWDDDLFDRDAYLYLAPVLDEGSLLPVMTISYNFRLQRPMIRARVALYRLAGTEVQAIGYRFEAPEDVVGPHCYYHAQPIESFDRSGSRPIPHALGWWPTSLPTLPLDAHNGVGLLICIFLSLYGFTVFELMNGQPFVARLDDLLVGSGFPHGRYTRAARIAAADAIGRLPARPRARGRRRGR